MEFFASLQEIPSIWTPAPYYDKIFVRIAVEAESEEYQRMKSEFRQTFSLEHHDVRSIERIQAPIFYSRYNEKERAFRFIGETVTVKRRYITVDSEDALDTMMGNTCDLHDPLLGFHFGNTLGNST